MTTMRRVALVLLLLVVGCTTTVRTHPELQARLPRIRKVALVPPRVSYTLVTFKGDNQQLFEEEDKARRELLSPLRAAVPSTFDVNVLDPTPAPSGEGAEASVQPAVALEAPDASFASANVLDRFAVVVDEIFKQPQITKGQARKLNRTLGYQVSELASMAGADGVVLVKVQGWRKTRGERAKDIGLALLLAAGGISYYAPGSAVALQAVLVDGANGDVLWANIAGCQDCALTGPTLGQLAAAVWKNFPRD
jgi:hypothetical protein